MRRAADCVRLGAWTSAGVGFVPAAAGFLPAAAWIAAVAVGVSLGLLGSGGSILTVPLLQSVVGLTFPVAQATRIPSWGSWRRRASWGTPVAGPCADARSSPS